MSAARERPGIRGASPSGLARRRPEPDIEWILGDHEYTSWEREFDFAVMTGHAFQVLLGEDELSVAPAAARAALTDNGRFGFETRDPLARERESWTTVAPADVPGPGADGSGAPRTTRQVRSADGDIVSFRTGLALPGEHAPRDSDNSLRFLHAERLDAFLTEAGPVVEERYGDRDRGPPTDAGPEIVTAARRTPA
ncbi:SAM-dependent methyltransferase [Streptomyces sp. NPDC059943]|uniref:SAM-dependent methyltransferase n=1 Tax=Streptomyces sp. NPDC059943 TaxID=3347010 RepID=UPI003648BD04